MNGYTFTDRVREVLQLAREEVARLQHEYVGTEHLLLGLLSEEKGIAAQVLVHSGATLDRVTTALGTQLR
ncbi:MAG: Clp protease N-terminal domain-containing protein [Gemmatimonadota bacterium]